MQLVIKWQHKQISHAVTTILLLTNVNWKQMSSFINDDRLQRVTLNNASDYRANGLLTLTLVRWSIS